MTKMQVPEGTKCRSFGCNRKATSVILDTKGRRQYCCPQHDGSQRIKERKRCTTGKLENAKL
jgi:hypothetical protein